VTASARPGLLRPVTKAAEQGQEYGGSDLGLAERLISAVQTSWPFIVALTLYRTARRAPRHQAVQPAADRRGSLACAQRDLRPWRRGGLLARIAA
jgi:hypothetical protein